MERTPKMKSIKRKEEPPSIEQVTAVQEHTGQDQPTFSHLTHLSLERIDEVTTPHLLISSDHRNALTDILHARTNRKDISIVNTAFFRELLQAKANNYEQAQRYLQPDEEVQHLGGTTFG